VQTKKSQPEWHMDRKENPINAPSIHVGAQLCAGSLWPRESTKDWSKKNIRIKLDHTNRQAGRQARGLSSQVFDFFGHIPN
jgi:hypothetical protein